MKKPLLRDQLQWQQEETRKLRVEHQKLLTENDNLKKQLYKDSAEREQIRQVLAQVGKVLTITYGDY